MQYHGTEMAIYWRCAHLLQHTERHVVCLLLELVTDMLQKKKDKREITITEVKER